MLLRQLSYAIKNQLKAPKAPYWRHFLPSAGSLWHKDRYNLSRSISQMLNWDSFTSAGQHPVSWPYARVHLSPNRSYISPFYGVWKEPGENRCIVVFDKENISGSPFKSSWVSHFAGRFERLWALLTKPADIWWQMQNIFNGKLQNYFMRTTATAADPDL